MGSVQMPIMVLQLQCCDCSYQFSASLEPNLSTVKPTSYYAL